MSDDALIAAVAPCFCCKQPFLFDPASVVSIAVDPGNGLSPELGGDPARAVRQPLCDDCLAYIAAQRRRLGLPPHRIDRNA